MIQFYKRVDIKSDNSPVNFVGVHPITWHEHPNQPDAGFVEVDVDELIRNLEEYIKFLDNDISKNVTFLDIHHIHTSQEDIKKGMEYRETIAKLKKEVYG